MSYTVDTIPHLRCGECKYFNINADLEWDESSCKRIDHKKVKFFKNPFKSYDCGEWHVPCCDFEPKHPEYADYKDDWEGMENAWPVFRDAWGYEVRNRLAFHVNGNYDIDYLVPFELFYDGGMIEDGILKATGKRYVVRDKVEFGVQLYKIKTEKIQGVNIETGEEIVAEEVAEIVGL